MWKYQTLNKTASILLLLVILINTVGYRFIINALQKHEDTILENQYDNSMYSDRELIEIKLPVNLAYQTVNSDYQRFDGEIIINNISLKYVLRKVSNDTIYLKCLPNFRKTQLQKQKEDIAKNVSDASQDVTSKKGNNQYHHKFNIFSEYDFLESFEPLSGNKIISGVLMISNEDILRGCSNSLLIPPDKNIA